MRASLTSVITFSTSHGPEREHCLMTSLLPTAIPFPRSPTTWYFLPQRNKRSSLSKRDRRQQPDDIMPNDDMTDLEPKSPAPTGVEHWEEQRRKWTKGFAEKDRNKTTGEVICIERDDVWLTLGSFYCEN